MAASMRARLVAVGLLSLLAAACTSSPDEPVDRRIDVGAALALSGDSFALGQSQAEGLRLAARELGGFRLQIEDEASSVSVGEAAVAALVRRPVDVIVGPTHSNTTRAAYPLADVAEIPMLGISMTVPGLTAFRPYLWRTSLAGDRMLPPAVRDAVRRTSAHTAFVLSGRDDLLTRAEAELFTQTLDEEGVSVVGTATFVKNQRSFADAIAAAKAAAPDLLCVAALPGDAVAFLAQARAAGLTVPVVGGNGFNSGAIPSLGADAEGVTVGSAWSLRSTHPTNQRFVATFRQAYDHDPDQFAAQAYAGMQVLRAAARRGGATAAGIQNGLRSLATVDTVLGPLRFDDSRDAVHPSWLRVVTGGAFVARPAPG
jgi:branched-chain amino acid transport system substrate-binding protein